MATRGTSSSANSKTVSRGITTALSSAILEWMLIILLFIHAIFSYLITQFAWYCELQVPCLLCSRLDHVMGSKNPEFYWDLICHNHKLEISSLFHNICESCLSYATRNKIQFETYRTLIGKLSTTHCSCCNEPCIIKGHALKSVQIRSITSEVPELDVALSDIEPDQNYPKSRRVRRTMSINVTSLGNNIESDRLSHIGYTEIKITSDTESEVPVSVSDDDSNTLVLEMINQKKDIDVEYVQIQPHIVTLEDEFASEKLIDPASEHERNSIFVSNVHSDVVEDHGGVFVGPTLSIGHGLEELNWQHAEHKANLLPVTEDITVDDANKSSKSTENFGQVSKEAQSEDAVQLCEPESEDISKAENIQIKTTEIGLEISSDTNYQTPSFMELGDAYKIAVGNQAKQLSLKQLSLKESTRVSEDLKLLLSQLSANRGMELSIPDMSPRMFEDLKTPDASSSPGMKLFQKRISLERNESGFESLDGSTVSEIEGESVISRLKRQIDYDRTLMGGLYKELEEERNASAVAANQAMAMITRLQEEKAALHMEALHYLRMMEEQSEYDMEALQNSNDLLTQREKEIQDLEDELESYKNKEKDSSFEDNSKIKLNNKSVFEFDDERVYISECLKKLEKRVNLFSNDAEYCVNDEYKTSDSIESNHEENGFSSHNDVILNKESEEIDLGGIGNVVSNLNNRLEALEADRDFLELIVNSIKNKDEGLDYVHEIACHLRELRRIGERRKDVDVS